MKDKIRNERKEKILLIVKDKEYKPIKVKNIAGLMNVPIEARDEFTKLIDELLAEGKIILLKNGTITDPVRLKIFKGIFSGTSSGFGFISVDDGDDIFVPRKFAKRAMNKDEVLYKILKNQVGGKKAEAEVVKILHRAKTEIVGIYEGHDGFGFVLPSDKKLEDIYVSRKNALSAVTGNIVVVKLVKSEDETEKRQGKIIEIIGHINEPDGELKGILRQFNIFSSFPEDVVNEVNTISEVVEDSEILVRRDLRDKVIFTIDGADTKDIDDAVCVEKLENGNYLLGVHIADVTNYVKEGSSLDVEALKRGTSVYLVNKVVPMLPPKLSNGICSLNPGVDRLALSCEMEIDSKGKTVKYDIFESVICSAEKMTYDIVLDLLINKESEFKERYTALLPTLSLMEELSNILKDKRIARGSIDFDLPEAKIILNGKGKAVDVKVYPRNMATDLIEEFMLVCNQTIAEHFFWQEVPFVYRTHEEPDAEKIAMLSEFVKGLGYPLKARGSHPGALKDLLSSAKNTNEEKIVSRVVLRTMKQARYTTECIGHYGLALKYYCHFTSPIRRYPDLQIHRIIKKSLNGNLSEKYIHHLNKILTKVCDQSSETERNAESAEREIEKLKLIEFMSDKIGNQYEGVISGVTNFGIYVELENTVQGMVSRNTLNDDFYVYNKERYCYIGENLGKVYRLGDKVKIIVTGSVKEIGIDFEFVNE